MTPRIPGVEPQGTHPAVPILLQIPFPQRTKVAHRLQPPLLASAHGRCSNQCNLDLLLTVSHDPTQMRAGNLARILGWKRQWVNANLQWGARRGQLRRISARLYAVADPEVVPQLQTSIPAPDAFTRRESIP